MKYVCNRMPNNPNFFLAVLPKPACDTAQIVAPIVREITQNGISAARHLVFCRTYQETVELFQEAILQLSATSARDFMFLWHHLKHYHSHIVGPVKNMMPAQLKI